MAPGWTFLWRCQHVLKKSWKRMSLGESWVVCKEHTTQSLKTSWKEFIKCPCQDQLQWSIQCTFGVYFVGLETARWELYLRFYDLYLNSCFGSLYVLYIINIYICTYIMYINIRTPLWDYVCKTTCRCLPPLDFRLRHGSDMRFLCGRADHETGGQTMSKQQITEIMVYNKTQNWKNWPCLFGGFSSPPHFMGRNLPSKRHFSGCRIAAFARGFGGWIAMDFGSGRGADCCDARAPSLSPPFVARSKLQGDGQNLLQIAIVMIQLAIVFRSIFQDMDLHWYFLLQFCVLFYFPLLKPHPKIPKDWPNCSRKIVVFSAWNIPAEGTAISESLPRCFRVQRYF